ncbi:MAG TPA: S66 peptidase family protein [Patescibacteria group bacterium]|nr:S66 peptidase family protein [Patescibacteria group bacterium]
MKLIIPPPLTQEATIGFISPSAGLAPFAMHRIQRAIDYLERLGYQVKLGKHSLQNNGYVSASVDERIDDIHCMFADPSVKMILATIGGNHCNQLISKLDYNLIRHHPKIFVGYSDLTVLHYAIQSQAGLSTYYGPCAMTQFGEFPKPLEYTVKNFFAMTSDTKVLGKYLDIYSSHFWTDEVLDWFKNEDSLRPRKLKKNKGFEWLRRGKAHGLLLGGAIPSIHHLAGTQYWIDCKNNIFFIDIPEGNNLYEGLSIGSVDAYLADLYNLGVFQSISGLIIGRPYRYSEKDYESLKKIIEKYTFEFNFPILFNVDLGHTDPMTTIRYGSEACMDSTKNFLSMTR